MKIGIIAPYKEMVQSIALIHKKPGVELYIREATYAQALEEALKMETDGVEGIISRGATCDYIRRNCTLPIIHCNFSDMDLLHALVKAREFDGRIGLVTHSSYERIVGIFEKSLGIQLVPFFNYKTRQENLEAVEQLKANGIRVIVGGSVTVKIAEDLGMKSVLVQTSPEALEQTIDEAVRVVEIVRKERAQMELIGQIINHVSDAIVLLDSAGNIILTNPGADELLGKVSNGSKSFFSIAKNKTLLDGIKRGSFQRGLLVTLGESSYMCRHQPIQLDKDSDKTVLFLQDTSRIQTMESQIRTHLHNKGHQARYTIDMFVGKSRNASNCREMARRYAKYDSTVLITGESGTGKEVLAQSIHNLSDRNKGPFVAINCSALAMNLLESELFGYDEGAFTGAKKGGQPGLFEVAHGGTIFLDEIGSITPEIQNNLLRVIQEKEIRRLGSNKVIPVDVRILAATNSDLRAKVRSGKFRLDLFYRLCVLDILMPPLRERKGDIPLIARELCPRYNMNFSLIPETAINKMIDYDWPGNVRELQNFIEKASLLANHIPPEELLESFISQGKNIHSEPLPGQDENTVSIKKDTLANMEMEIIQKRYKECGYNKTLLADVLNISRVTVWNKLNQLAK